MKIWNDIIDFFLPPTCLTCHSPRQSKEIFCLNCSSLSPETDHFKISDNELCQRVDIRVSIEHGAALYYFYKSGIVQKAIHALKYSGRKDIAEISGIRFAEYYRQSPFFSKADLIVPVPADIKRQRKRGYNQAECFGRAISLSCGIPLCTKAIIKQSHHKSLTRKTRHERFVQVKESFRLINTEILKNKHILLVDDVLTTGATIEAIADLIYDINKIPVQIAVIALAEI